MARREVARVVYRNTITRRDAAYVLQVIEDDIACCVEIFGLYGTWAQFMSDPLGLSYLRGHDKPKHRLSSADLFLRTVNSKLQTLCYERENKGYELQPQFTEPGAFHVPNPSLHLTAARRPAPAPPPSPAPPTSNTPAPAAPTARVIDVAEQPEQPQRYDGSRVEFIEL